MPHSTATTCLALPVSPTLALVAREFSFPIFSGPQSFHALCSLQVMELVCTMLVTWREAGEGRDWTFREDGKESLEA